MKEETGIAECIQRIQKELSTLGVNGEIIISDDSIGCTPDITTARWSEEC